MRTAQYFVVEFKSPLMERWAVLNGIVAGDARSALNCAERLCVEFMAPDVQLEDQRIKRVTRQVFQELLQLFTGPPWSKTPEELEQRFEEIHNLPWPQLLLNFSKVST